MDCVIRYRDGKWRLYGIGCTHAVCSQVSYGYLVYLVQLTGWTILAVERRRG